LAKSRTGKFDGTELIDGYQTALADLVRDKLAKRHYERLAARNSSGGRGPKPSSRRKAVTRAVH
jgi:non-homologous end joining protein Ku